MRSGLPGRMGLDGEWRSRRIEILSRGLTHTMITVLLTAVLGAEAHAGLIDEYASRYDWACAYGGRGATCGGPDTYEGFDTAHTVEICQDEAGDMECGHTHRASLSSEETLAQAMKVWGKTLEQELGSTDWVLTPARDPDSWMAALRNRTTLASIEVGRDYVQLRTEDRPLCASKTAGEQLEPYVRPVLPEVKGDRVKATLELPWVEAHGMHIKGITDDLIAKVLARPENLDWDRSSLERWTLLASEPYQCVMEIKELTEVRQALPKVLDEWEKAEIAARKRERKEKRKAANQ